MNDGDGEPGPDPSAVIEAITELMLGEAPHLRRADVSEQSGVPQDVARARWRALGFPEADDDDVAFTDADVEALRLTQELVGLGVIEPDTEQAFIRTIGRSFARLAEWQVRAFLGSVPADAMRRTRSDSSRSSRRSCHSVSACRPTCGGDTW